MSRPVGIGPDTVVARDTLDGMVRDWLFLLLRYAVSRAICDRQAVLEQAATMDTLDRHKDRGAFRFFRSHSETVCAAIAAPDTPGRRQILLAHVRRIGEPRLEQMFMLACHLDVREKTYPGFGRISSRSELWQGLQRRR
ncbi:MAG: hypothetical protein AB7U62_21100 [Pseudolabrys sp.]